MAGEITREEILAFTQANKDQALALNKVCELVEANGLKLDKLVEKLGNGLKSEIVEEIVGKGDEKTSLNAIKRDTSSMSPDISFSKYVIGATALIVIICTVLSALILRSANISSQALEVKTAQSLQSFESRQAAK